VKLKVSRPFFEQVKPLHVTIDLSLAMTTVRIGTATRMTIPQGEFSIPSGSICARSGIWANDLSCRSAMRQPPLTLVVTRFSTGECSGERMKNDGDAGLGWVGTVDSDPAEFGITSVWTSSVYFGRISRGESKEEQHLCAGSTLVFAPYTPVERTQEKVTTQAIGLEHLTTKLAM
jgi:hypothetical protein